MVKVKKTKEQVITEKLNEKATEDQEVAHTELVKEATGKVTVCCGIPMGLKLELAGGPLVLKGMPLSHIVSARKGVGFLPAGKFGETVVTQDQWDEILAKYKNFDFIKNGTVFAESSREAAEDKAQEKSEKHLGFEQIDPAKTKTTKVNTEE